MKERGTYQSRINKPNRRFPLRNPLLINPRKNRREHRRRSARAPNKRRQARIVNKYIITNSRDIRVSPPVGIIDTAISAKGVIVRGRIERILRARCGEVVRYSRGLVGGDGVDI